MKNKSILMSVFASLVSMGSMEVGTKTRHSKKIRSWKNGVKVWGAEKGIKSRSLKSRSNRINAKRKTK